MIDKDVDDLDGDGSADEEFEDLGWPSDDALDYDEVDEDYPEDEFPLDPAD